MQLEKLEKYGGQWSKNALLTEMTWLRLKNTYAQFLWLPETPDQLSTFVSDKIYDYFLLGNGSNTILGNLDKILIVTKELNYISFDDDQVIVGSGFNNRKLVLESLARGLGGLEFIYTIPGTIGGTVCMNGGAHCDEIGRYVNWVEVIRKVDGKMFTIFQKDIKFSYRYSNLPEEYIVTSVALKLYPILLEETKEKLRKYQEYVNLKQPRAFTLGSTFKNPPNRRAWELLSNLSEIELKSKNFYFSPLHRNFLINNGEGTMQEAMALINRVQRLVKSQDGIELELELKWAGC